MIGGSHSSWRVIRTPSRKPQTSEFRVVYKLLTKNSNQRLKGPVLGFITQRMVEAVVNQPTLCMLAVEFIVKCNEL
jgi:hypothetical protein